MTDVARLDALRTAEANVAALEADAALLRDRGRCAIGVTGRAERLGFASVLRAAGARWRPLVALCALALGDAMIVTAVTLARPGLRRSIGGGALGSLPPFWPALFALGALAAVAAQPRLRGRRPFVARTALSFSALAAATCAVSTASVAALAAALGIALASGAGAAVVAPMLVDAHRPEIRVRVLAAYAGAVMAGVAVAAFVFAIGGGVGLTWRSELLVLSALAALTVAAARLVDPPVGRFDRDRVTAAVEQALGGSGDARAELDEVDVALTMAEHLRRVVAPEAARALLLQAAVFGMALRALPAFLDVFLRDRWTLVASTRTLAYGALCLVSLPGLAWFARRGEVAFHVSASRLLQRAASVATLTAVALVAATIAPVFAVTAVMLAVAFAGFAVMLATAATGLLALTDPNRRGHAAALMGIAVAVGGLVGQQLIATIGSRFGAAWALETAAAAVLAGASALVRAVPVVDGEIDALVARMIELDELTTRVTQGQHLPLLSCRHVDFAYGRVQVLFDVSFTVDDGEMVALLGTNGAGKSTLLRLISGLGSVSAGSVHYRGADVTFLDADRRVKLGISQIPGGRAVFGPMTVVDNLRAYGHTIGHDRPRLDRDVDEVFAALPRLGERRNQLASTLSGGEQQMLALGKAFILAPRLLLIDELSLGLAPKVVGELLDMVRRLNEAGTAVVLVEQSVNVALSVVHHAYFMEKGEMRFDGVAHELLARPDLLRSVFFQGADRGLSA